MVATRPTAKVREATKMSGVYIVRLDWLRDTVATWTRMDEEDYGLQDIPVYREPVNTEEQRMPARRMSLRELESMDAEVCVCTHKSCVDSLMHGTNQKG